MLCFELTRIGESEPSALADVDRDVCDALGVTCDPVHYCEEWYAVLGDFLVQGGLWHDIAFAVDYRSSLFSIFAYLDGFYTCKCWRT